MDFVDGLQRVPTFVPPRWVVSKNMLFDLEGFSADGLEPEERLFFEQQIRDASLLFAATSSDRVGSRTYDAHCYVGGGDVFDYQFKIKRSKTTVFDEVGEVNDVYDAAERASAFMFGWHWFPERLLAASG